MPTIVDITLRVMKKAGCRRKSSVSRDAVFPGCWICSLTSIPPEVTAFHHAERDVHHSRHHAPRDEEGWLPQKIERLSRCRVPGLLDLLTDLYPP